MSEVVIRPVAPGDVEELQKNCFPRSTHDEVHRLVEASLRGALEGRYVHLVAEDDGMVVGTIELGAQSGRARHRGELFRFVEAVADVPIEVVSRWFATGMLLNVIAAMDLHTDPEPWAVQLMAGCKDNQD